MKKSNIVFVVVFLLPLFYSKPTRAQDNETLKQSLKDIGGASANIVTKSATKTTGSPYLNDKFLKGYLLQKGGGKTEVIPLRYNMEKNRVEFLREKKVFVTNSKKLDGFEFITNDKNMVFRNGYSTEIKDIGPDTFLNVLYDGKAKLLVLYKAILHKNIATYGTATKKNKYQTSSKYYLVTQDGTFHKLKSIKKDVVKILANHKDKITNYANSMDLNFKKKEDLVKILKFYDKITS